VSAYHVEAEQNSNPDIEIREQKSEIAVFKLGNFHE